ncbi:MAG: ABC transporter ATP-binding protein [Actinobacteria bacterium]|nr:ABC transporter ATP-binding protein [Actinomycetota bacterium]
MLEIDALHAGYGDLEVLHGVSLRVSEGEVVALIGANGAGKTTTMRTVSGLMRPTSGTITYEGNPIHTWRPRRIVEHGLIQVPEARKLFPGLTVAENLAMGAYRRGRSRQTETLKEVLEIFPRLEERRCQEAGTLSGGEQQMLAIGRALMARPKLLMLDEPSLGLAPILVAGIFDVVRDISRRGVTVVLVEQNAVHALQICDRGYVLESGHVVIEGTGEQLLGNDRVRSAYLGM